MITPPPWEVGKTRLLNEGTYAESQEVWIVAPQIHDNVAPMVIAIVEETWQPWDLHDNARLIAMAPQLLVQRDELLEALEMLVDGYVGLYTGKIFAMEAEGDECMEKARSVIAKVRGEM